MNRTYIDIPEIIIGNEEVWSEHKEEKSICEVSEVDQDKMVNVGLFSEISITSQVISIHISRAIL